MAYNPYGATGLEDWSSFSTCAPLSRFIFDRPIVSIPLLPGGHCNNSLVSMGTGTPAVAEINTSEVGGFTLDADNESVSFLFPFPLDIDLSKEIDLRMLWSNSESAATGTGRVLWYHKAITAGTTAIAVATTAPGSVAAAQVDLAANVVLWSGWSVIAASTFAANVAGDDVLIVKAYVDLTTIANMTLYMAQVRYYRKYLA